MKTITSRAMLDAPDNNQSECKVWRVIYRVRLGHLALVGELDIRAHKLLTGEDILAVLRLHVAHASSFGVAKDSVSIVDIFGVS